MSSVYGGLWRFPMESGRITANLLSPFLTSLEESSDERACNVIYDRAPSINIINNIVSHLVNIRVSLAASHRRRLEYRSDNMISYFFLGIPGTVCFVSNGLINDIPSC